MLAPASATQLLTAFREGATTPSEAVDACLKRLDEREPAHHAFRTRCDDAARTAASLADERWRRGEPRSLEGVPFAAKDNIETAGVLTTAGSRLYDGWIPERNATAVERLLRAGAILIGKTATPELAFGDAIEGHQAVHPSNPDRWTGGSSSGSAVALAVDEVPIALGTDTGGSIRVPASYCGVVGLKPTFGAVPRTGVVPVSWTLDHTGPMAQTIEDLRLVLAAIAGHSPHDPSSSTRALALDAGSDDLTGLAVGVPREWFLSWGAPEVLDGFARAVEALAELGAAVRDVSLPHAHLAGEVAWTITVTEFASLREADLDRLDLMTPSAAARFRAGAAMLAGDYLRALQTRTLVQNDLEAAFSEVDLIITPGTPTPAPRITPPIDALFEGGDQAWLERIARNFLFANVTGVPALVLPVDVHDDLPIAVQLVAPMFADATCLRVGQALESTLASVARLDIRSV